MRFKTLILLAISFVGTQAFAQSDAQDYCAYLNHEANGQAIQLRTPQGVAGVTQPNTGTAVQLYTGAQGSLSDFLKGRDVRSAAKAGCNLYRSTQDAQVTLQYAQAYLERSALEHKAATLVLAIQQIDKLIAQNKVMVDAQSATRFSLYSLQETRARLMDARTQADRQLASIYVPDLSMTPISQLISLKQGDEQRNQDAQEKINRKADWDLRWEAGYHKTPNNNSSLVQPSGAYAGFNFSYNLGSHRANKEFDKAATSYVQWKKDAESDVVQEAQTLQSQLLRGIAAEEQRHSELIQQMTSINTNLSAVGDSSTATAQTYVNQLQGDKITLEVEQKDNEYRLTSLKTFLAQNFGDHVESGSAMVSLTFDDGFQSAFDATEVLDKAGLHGTYYIITKALGTKGYMTEDEVKQLASRGHEVGGHSRTHPHLPLLTLEQQEAEIGGGRDDLKALGINAQTFAYPYGEHNSITLAALQASGYKGARTTDNTLSGRDPFLLQGYSLNNKTLVTDVIAAIDNARRNGTWLILTFHRVNETSDNQINVSQELLQQIVNYLVQTNTKVVTVKDGLNIPTGVSTPTVAKDSSKRVNAIPAAKGPVL